MDMDYNTIRIDKGSQKKRGLQYHSNGLGIRYGFHGFTTDHPIGS